ncbi:MAG: MurR/RpiR family transcriptional regulator [Acidimicrobiales bacterium]
MAAAEGRLTPSESRVARYFADHREEAAFLSAAEMAEVLGVSDATVIRAAQALGYRGLPELKDELREVIRARATPAVRWTRTLDLLGHDDEALVDQLLATQIEVLAEARRWLRPEDFAAAVELVAGAERIVVAGFGPLGVAADYFVLTLRRIGRAAMALTGRSTAFVDGLVELRAGDVLVIVVYEQIVAEIDLALDQAAERGVPCVLVTDNLALALEGRYEVALTSPRGPTDLVPSIAVPVVIIEALIFGIIGQNRPRAVAALDDLNRLRGRLGSG